MRYVEQWIEQRKPAWPSAACLNTWASECLIVAVAGKPL